MSYITVLCVQGILILSPFDFYASPIFHILISNLLVTMDTCILKGNSTPTFFSLDRKNDNTRDHEVLSGIERQISSKISLKILFAYQKSHKMHSLRKYGHILQHFVVPG